MRRKGDILEKAVASLHSKIDPNSIVTHDEKIIDKYGHSRQFDVVIRGEIGGRSLLGVIECKDWKAKVDVAVVDGFLTKIRDVNANFGIIASNSGFTKNALEKCMSNGIGAISLIPNDDTEIGFPIKMHVFAQEFSWKNFRVNITGRGPFLFNPNTSMGEIYINGTEFSLLDWFLYFLDNKYDDSDLTLGEYKKEIVFRDPQIFIVNSNPITVAGIEFFATKVVKNKQKWINIWGEGIYEWNEDSLTLPSVSDIKLGPFSNRLDDWDEYEGEINLRPGNDIRLILYVKQYYKDQAPIDISEF